MKKNNRSKTNTCTRLLCFFNSKLASYFNIPPQIFNMNIKSNFLCLFSHQTTIIQVLTTYM